MSGMSDVFVVFISLGVIMRLTSKMSNIEIFQMLVSATVMAFAVATFAASINPHF